MQQTITAKLKLSLSDEQRKLVGETCLAFRYGLNYASHKAFENGKVSSKKKLHHIVYQDLRNLYGLPSQMACEVSRQVASTYKGLWTKVKQNAQHLKSGRTKKRYKGLDEAPQYVSRTVTLNYGRDFSFNKGKLSIKTLNKRLKDIEFSGYKKHLDLLNQPESNVEASTKSGGRTVHTASRYHRARKTLQQKDTRSAKRRLVALSKRERRFKADINHSLANQLIELNSLIGIENLANIRERTNRKKNKKASTKRKKANSKQSRWAFAELQTFIAYKAKFANSFAVKVDADYSSQQCTCCSHRSKENRPNKGLLFVCQSCGFKLHADLVGARNVAMRVFSVWQDWTETGILSICPDVTCNEAKAERMREVFGIEVEYSYKLRSQASRRARLAEYLTNGNLLK